MSTSAQLERRLALRLVLHAAAVLPRTHSAWGTSMRHEIEYIQSERDALKWALGCVTSSYRQWIASWNMVETPAIRWVLILLIVSWAHHGLLAVRMFHAKMTGALQPPIALNLPSTLIPWSEFFPVWILALTDVSALLYIVAAYCLMRKRVSSVPVLLAATAMNMLACGVTLILLSLEFGWDFARGALFGWSHFILKFCLVFLLWQGFESIRQRDGSRSEPKS